MNLKRRLRYTFECLFFVLSPITFGPLAFLLILTDENGGLVGLGFAIYVMVWFTIWDGGRVFTLFPTNRG